MKKNVTPLRDNLRLFFCFVLLFFTILNSYSQSVRYDSVKKQKYVLVDVEKTYERIIDKGYESIEMFESLGNYYYEHNNLRKSKLYFDKLFGKYNTSQISPKSIERYQIIKKL